MEIFQRAAVQASDFAADRKKSANLSIFLRFASSGIRA
jgi:hypothetical protein